MLATKFEAAAGGASKVGVTPVHQAAAGGHAATVRLLVVELGADASAGDMDGLTPVHHAAAGGHAATVRLLVSELGAEADAADVDGLTAVHCAALRAGLDEGLLSLTLPILFYMDNPYRCNECQ
jgi:ankyrin repeat protein